MRPLPLLANPNRRLRERRKKEHFSAFKELGLSRIGASCRGVSHSSRISAWRASFLVAAWRALSRSSKETRK